MREALKTHLTNSDLVELMTLSYKSLSCNDYDALKTLVLDLKRLIPFDSAVCVYGDIATERKKPIPEVDIFDISYPENYLELYLQNQFHMTDGVITHILKTLEPANWLEVKCETGNSYPDSVLASDFNMNDGWTHGVLDTDAKVCSLFYLGSPYKDSSLRSQIIVQYIVSFFTEAYKKVLNKQKQLPTKLTNREIEVLNWLKDGKRSYEISVILNCSERTVYFHITNIKEKLNVVTCAQAVAVGLEHGIIGL